MSLDELVNVLQDAKQSVEILDLMAITLKELVDKLNKDGIKDKELLRCVANGQHVLDKYYSRGTSYV